MFKWYTYIRKKEREEMVQKKNIKVLNKTLDNVQRV